MRYLILLFLLVGCSDAEVCNVDAIYIEYQEQEDAILDIYVHSADINKQASIKEKLRQLKKERDIKILNCK